jgi:hypothetical protein
MCPERRWPMFRVPACSSPATDPQLLRGVLSGRRVWISSNLEKNDV